MFLMLMLVVDSMQRCTNPKAENGDHITEGCLKRICKSSIWRSSLVSNKCCYNREVFSVNTTIYSSMSEDGCAKAALDCVEETPGTAKTVLSVKNYCEDYATKDQLEEIKKMLLEQKKEGSGCRLGENVETKYDKEEHKILFIGPDGGYNGKSIVLGLPDLTPLDCNIPVFPGGDYYKYVGRSTSDGVLMCGGMTNSGPTSSCYLLTSSGYKTMPGLKNRRIRAASVVTPSGLWVTGGTDDRGQYFDTTEIWSNNQSRQHVRLPEKVYAHCLTTLNRTHALLTGGYREFGSSSAAYIFSDTTGFTRIEDMKTARKYHGCPVINESTVLVAGGQGISSTEYLDFTSLTWSPGPELPKSVNLAQILGPEVLGPEIGGHLIKGTGKIFKLEEEGPSQARGWAKVWGMINTGSLGQAFVVNKKLFC